MKSNKSYNFFEYIKEIINLKTSNKRSFWNTNPVLHKNNKELLKFSFDLDKQIYALWEWMNATEEERKAKNKQIDDLYKELFHLESIWKRKLFKPLLLFVWIILPFFCILLWYLHIKDNIKFSTVDLTLPSIEYKKSWSPDTLKWKAQKLAKLYVQKSFLIYKNFVLKNNLVQSLSINQDYFWTQKDKESNMEYVNWFNSFPFKEKNEIKKQQQKIVSLNHNQIHKSLSFSEYLQYLKKVSIFWKSEKNNNSIAMYTFLLFMFLIIWVIFTSFILYFIVHIFSYKKTKDHSHFVDLEELEKKLNIYTSLLMTNKLLITLNLLKQFIEKPNHLLNWETINLPNLYKDNHIEYDGKTTTIETLKKELQNYQQELKKHWIFEYSLDIIELCRQSNIMSLKIEINNFRLVFYMIIFHIACFILVLTNYFLFCFFEQKEAISMARLNNKIEKIIQMNPQSISNEEKPYLYFMLNNLNFDASEQAQKISNVIEEDYKNENLSFYVDSAWWNIKSINLINQDIEKTVKEIKDLKQQEQDLDNLDEEVIINNQNIENDTI